jgi:hypothetical protein
MLHLLPIRQLFKIAVALIGLAVLAAMYAGAVGTGDALNDAKWIIRWSPVAALAITLIPYASWRWMARVQRLIFPYLGGEWIGELDFGGPNGTGVRDVKLMIDHSFLKIDLILDSAESTSRTLVVHADRDKGINRDRLYYVYLNERKEGVRGAGDRYRGLAVLRVETANGASLHGDYFTERLGTGKLRLARRKAHPWWAVWK